MKKFIYLFLILFSINASAQTFDPVGNSLQRKATSKGYRYRFSLGLPGFATWYTDLQIDSIIAENKAKTDSVVAVNKALLDSVKAVKQDKILGTVVPFNGIVASADPVQRAIEKLQYQISNSSPSIAASTWKGSVRVVTTTNITLSGNLTYNGVVMANGEPILVNGQTTLSQNGTWAVNTSGAWARTVDNSTGATMVGSVVNVGPEDGQYPSSQWTLSTPGPITVGTTALSYTRVTQPIIPYPFMQVQPYVFYAIKDITLIGADPAKYYHIKYFFSNDIGNRFNITIAMASTIGGTTTDVASYSNSTGPLTGIQVLQLTAAGGSTVTGHIVIDFSYITAPVTYNVSGSNSYSNRGINPRVIAGLPDQRQDALNTVLPQVPFPLVKTSVTGLRGGFMNVTLNNADRHQFYYISNFEKNVVYGGAIGTRALINIKAASDINSVGTSVCSFSFQDPTNLSPYNCTGIQTLTLTAQGGSGITGTVTINWDAYNTGASASANSYLQGGLAAYTNDAIAPVDNQYAHNYPMVKYGKYSDFSNGFIRFYLSNARRDKYYYISNMENARVYAGLYTRWIVTINEASDPTSTGTQVCQFYFTDATNTVTKTGVQEVALGATAPSIIGGTAVINWDKMPVNTAYTAASYKETGFAYIPGTILGVQNDYELRDNIKVTVNVNADGTGDYTTVAAAYAAYAASSNYDNQVLFKVYPGVYNESNIVPPPFSHTLAVGPLGSVVFYDNGGVRGFDITYSCKITGIVSDVINESSYNAHIDLPTLSYGFVGIYNCKFIHRLGGGSAAVIGQGAWPDLIVRFEDTQFIGFVSPPTVHTKENSDYRMKLQYKNCTFGSGMNLISLGTYGQSEAEFIGCNFKGNFPGLSVSLLTNEPQLWKYPANNQNWKISGYGNKNFIWDMRAIANAGQALQITANTVNQSVALSGTAAGVLFGPNANWKVTKQGTRVYGKVIGWADVRDIRMGDSLHTAYADVIQMWARLGDCSSVNKTLTVTVNGVAKTYTFTANYLTTKPSETSLLAAINAVITNATISSINGVNYWEVLNTSDRVGSQATDANGILKDELVLVSGYTAGKVAQSTAAENITGIAVYDAAQGEVIDVWAGAFYTGLADGDYGVGSNNQLSLTDNPKVGYVKSNIFYPLYGKDKTVPATETDPTVPAYAKTLTAFSVIKPSTDALYKTITYTPSSADITTGLGYTPLSANQTISFSPIGDVTGSTTGATSLAPALVIGSGRVVNSMIAVGTIDLTTKVTGLLPNANLANSTISGISLGSNLATLTAGTSLVNTSGSNYNGSAATTLDINLAHANNFTAEQQITLTTEQFRLNYDVSHYSAFTVSSTGALTLAGTGAGFTVNGNVSVSSTNYGLFYTVYENSIQPYDTGSDLILRQRNAAKNFLFQNSSSISQLTVDGATGKLSFVTGSNKAIGTATLVAGTVTVSNTAVTAGSIILLTRTTAGGTVGTLSYTVSAGTSFTITSSSAIDTSTIGYLIVN
jgi:hypothetical protein